MWIRVKPPGWFLLYTWDHKNQSRHLFTGVAAAASFDYASVRARKRSRNVKRRLVLQICKLCRMTVRRRCCTETWFWTASRKHRHTPGWGLHKLIRGQWRLKVVRLWGEEVQKPGPLRGSEHFRENCKKLSSRHSMKKLLRKSQRKRTVKNMPSVIFTSFIFVHNVH